MLFCGKSDIGKKRSSNQDSFDITQLGDALLCTVCDGMGGANGGNIASSLAIRVYTEAVAGAIDGKKPMAELDVRKIMNDAVRRANNEVYCKAADDAALDGMGTTLVSALIYGDTLYAANVGDSRLYMCDDNGLVQLTRDHSYVQYLIDLGKLTPEEAEKAPMRNIITRSVGNEADVSTDTSVISLTGGCHLLLCSDGLSSYVSSKVISDIITGDGELSEKAGKLVDAALEGGGGDNITVILVSL